MDSIVTQLGRYRKNAKTVDAEEIEQYIASEVEVFMKCKLKGKANGIQEKYAKQCNSLSKLVENISRAVLREKKASMYIVGHMVRNLFWECDGLVERVNCPWRYGTVDDYISYLER